MNDFTRSSGSRAERRQATLVTVKNYYGKVGAAEVLITANELKLRDEILIIGPTTGVVQQTVTSMEVENQSVEDTGKGQRVGVAEKYPAPGMGLNSFTERKYSR